MFQPSTSVFGSNWEKIFRAKNKPRQSSLPCEVLFAGASFSRGAALFCSPKALAQAKRRYLYCPARRARRRPSEAHGTQGILQKDPDCAVAYWVVAVDLLGIV
jgi:hypothetical protein